MCSSGCGPESLILAGGRTYWYGDCISGHQNRILSTGLTPSAATSAIGFAPGLACAARSPSESLQHHYPSTTRLPSDNHIPSLQAWQRLDDRTDHGSMGNTPGRQSHVRGSMPQWASADTTDEAANPAVNEKPSSDRSGACLPQFDSPRGFAGRLPVSPPGA